MKEVKYTDIVRKLVGLFDLADSIQNSLDECGKGFASAKSEQLKGDVSFVLKFLTKDIQQEQKDNLQELLRVKPELRAKVQKIIEPLIIKDPLDEIFVKTPTKKLL